MRELSTNEPKGLCVPAGKAMPTRSSTGVFACESFDPRHEDEKISAPDNATTPDSPDRNVQPTRRDGRDPSLIGGTRPLGAGVAGLSGRRTILTANRLFGRTAPEDTRERPTYGCRPERQ